MVFRDFLGSSVVKTSPSNSGGWSSIPGQRAKNPTCLMASKSKHREKNGNNIVTNSVKDFKMVHILMYIYIYISNESTLRMRWPKYWSFSFSIIPSKEIPGLISFRMDWLGCWEGLGAGGEGDGRGWDGWMALLTRWTSVSVNSGSWWWTGRPGVLRFMGSQRVGHDWATDLIWSDIYI